MQINAYEYAFRKLCPGINVFTHHAIVILLCNDALGIISLDNDPSPL